MSSQSKPTKLEPSQEPIESGFKARSKLQFTEILDWIKNWYQGNSSDSNGHNIHDELARATRDLAVLMVILSYFSGWVYANSYFYPLGIRLANLEVSLYYFFVFSFTPLHGWITGYPFYPGIGLFLTFLIVTIFLRKRFPSIAILFSLLFTAISLFLVYYGSKQVGAEEAKLVLENKGGIRINVIFQKKIMDDFELKNPKNCSVQQTGITIFPDPNSLSPKISKKNPTILYENKKLCDLRLASNEGKLRLIWIGKDTYYFMKISKQENSKIWTYDTYMVPKPYFISVMVRRL